LKEYALVVNSLEEISNIIKNYQSKNLPLYRDHLWEYYEQRIRKTYETCLNLKTKTT
jgi:hypothetical protein